MRNAKDNLIARLRDAGATSFSAVALVDAYRRELEAGLRDELAVAAIGPVFDSQTIYVGEKPHKLDEHAKRAYEIADAMLRARAPGGEKTDRQKLVDTMGEAMSRKLAEHEEKGPWHDLEPAEILDLMKTETTELVDAFMQGASPRCVEDEAADIANYAAIFADNYRRRHDEIEAKRAARTLKASAANLSL